MFGFSLAVTVDGEEQHGAGDEEELAPLPLGSLRVALRGGAPAGAAALPRGARGRGVSDSCGGCDQQGTWTAQHSVDSTAQRAHTPAAALLVVCLVCLSLHTLWCVNAAADFQC